MKSHQDGISATDAIAEEFGIDVVQLRWFASHHLNETMPHLEEIGSSDVSIHLAHLGNHEPELLRKEAEIIRDRAALLKRIAQATGKTEAQTLADLPRLFAPRED